MIVKIKSWEKPQFRKLLEYMIHDKDRLTGTDGRGFLLLNNLTGRTIDAWTRQLSDIESRRKQKRKQRTYCFHEILSFSKDDADKLTAEKLEDMAREYIRLRGKGAAIAVPHYDKAHYHIHLLVSGTDLTGKSMRLTRGALRTLKANIERYQRQKYPEFVNSTIRHGRGSKAITSDREYRLKARAGRMTKREQVAKMVSECYAQSTSQVDFFAWLGAYKFSIYQRGGKAYGVVYQNRKYRFKALNIPLDTSQKISMSTSKGKDLGSIRKKDAKEHCIFK